MHGERVAGQALSSHSFAAAVFFGHSDPAMEEALHDIPLYREFAKLDAGITRLPNVSTILRFRHMLEQNDMGAEIRGRTIYLKFSKYSLCKSNQQER
jgi:hypothetical protein